MERRRPSTTWFWIAGALALAGMVGGIALGLHTYRLYEGRLDALARSAVPGEVTLEVAEPQVLTIHYEEPRISGGFAVRWNDVVGDGPVESPVGLEVTGPSGSPIPTVAYGSDLSFDVGGRVATALATFDATEPGTYTVEATGDVPEDARVSVGHVVDGGMVARVVGAVLVFVGTLLVAALMVVVVAYRRSRTPQPA